LILHILHSSTIIASL